MDTGEGRFEKLHNEDEFKERILGYPKAPKSVQSLFHVGERVQIKESYFEIENIGQHRMRLKLLER